MILAVAHHVASTWVGVLFAIKVFVMIFGVMALGWLWFALLDAKPRRPPRRW